VAAAAAAAEAEAAEAGVTTRKFGNNVVKNARQSLLHMHHTHDSSLSH
jgi:hypothetical protein